MSKELEELQTMKKRLTEIEALCEKNAAEREANGHYDDSLLEECMALFEYATYHDGRYGQVGSYDKFQGPAQKLVARLGKRLKREPYARFKG